MLLGLSTDGIVLASGSPRRIQLLKSQGLKFTVIPSRFEENLDKSKYTAAGYVRENAKCKAEEVVARLIQEQKVELPSLVIGADTVVVEKNGVILEKPKSKEEAHAMLKRLSGTHHTVLTGVALLTMSDAGQTTHQHVFVEESKVWFSQLPQSVISAYVETGEPLDKAGAYGIQALGGSFVERIEGCYYNIVGFPLSSFCRAIRKLLVEPDSLGAQTATPGGAGAQQ